MSDTIEWAGAYYVGIEVVDADALREMSETLEDEEPAERGIVLYNGCSHRYVIEGSKADLRAFVTRLTKALDQADREELEERFGFKVGEVVKVGEQGRKPWRIITLNEHGFAWLVAHDDEVRARGAEVRELVKVQS